MSAEFDVPRATLDALISHVKKYGAEVKEIWDEPEGARFVGTFEGRCITLYPKFDRHFALYFTVAHLYGHMVQATRRSETDVKAIEVVSRIGKPVTAQEVQWIYAHELEAAAIGRKLVAALGPVDRTLDEQYSRFFFADFHYLVNFIETGKGGAELFELYLRREPVPWRLIEPDPKPLVDVAKVQVVSGSAVVV